VARNSFLSVSFAIRLVVLVVAAVAALGILPWAWAPMALPATSPFVAACVAIAARSASWVTLLGLPVLILVLLRRRGFCRHACPVGLLNQYAGRLSPMPKTVCRKLPPLGQWFALLTLGGAAIGYPFFIWLDPLALFNGFFGLWQRPFGWVVALPALGLPLVVLLSFLVPGLWCQRLCPLGATQDLLRPRYGKKPAKEASAEETAEEAIDEPAPSRPLVLARRALLGLGLGAGWAAWTSKAVASSQAQPIRPPGAADEVAMKGLCVRCGNCIRACPAKILHPDLGQHGLASWLTPVVRFTEDYCRESCHLCTQVCPSGAIRRLTLDEKRQTLMGLAKADMSICLLNERDCLICRNHCPYDAISTDWDWKEYIAVLKIDPNKCIGCGACELVCVTVPEKAIRVVAASELASI
jgi:ferredoxin